MGDSLHFVGVLGSGMSALAQFHALGGGETSGSDRELDRGRPQGFGGGTSSPYGLVGGASGAAAKLAALGIRLFPQDGTGVRPGLSALVASTAIEEGNADLGRARARGLPIVHRADHLAALAAVRRTVAVAGTSGKSTVTAMVFEILEAGGQAPSVITGGGLLRLEEKGLLGNAWRGKSDLLVIEADESDGTLPKYGPWLGVLLNIGKDHKPLPEIKAIFSAFRGRCARFVVNAEAEGLADLLPGGMGFGFRAGELRAERLELSSAGLRFEVSGVEFVLPLPGRHNAENALAAAAAALQCGVPLAVSARALASFRGVARRFQSLGSAGGVEVVDDYAHNPDKIRAVLAAARLRSARLLAVWQPHGFYPTRFLKDELIAAFGELRPDDRLWLPDIYYAGGTVAKDISSADIVRPLAATGRLARHVPDREAVLAEVAAEARPGDLVLVLGARDPSLGDYARRLLAALRARAGETA